VQTHLAGRQHTFVALCSDYSMTDEGERTHEVGLWHKAEVQGCFILGPVTAALPTFGAQCRFTAAFQTQNQAMPKVAV